MGDAGKLAQRFQLVGDGVSELLLDFEAYGWVYRVVFAGSGGWTLTEAGRMENERQLADELDESGSAAVVAHAHAAFLPLNAPFQTECTSWQVRPLPGEPMATNDHESSGASGPGSTESASIRVTRSGSSFTRT